MFGPSTALLSLRRPARRLVVAALICAASAWATGPPGRLLVLLPLLLLGPGFLIARSLRIAAPLPLFCLPALWLGLSLSSISILYLWAWTVGLVLSPPLLAGLALTLSLALLLNIWFAPPNPPLTPAERWCGLGLLAVFALTLATRFSQIHNLALPVWVDSVHHALLIRIVAETGTIPISLRPYLAVDNLPYHWGYHVIAGTLYSLSGLELPQLMLWSGQVLNALSVVAVAGLAAVLWRAPQAALVAALTTGLLLNMPAYYLSWGRYTQLSGLLVLPPLALLSLLAWQPGPEAQEHERQRLGLIIGSAILLAGLILIHYRVLIFWLPLLGLMTLVYADSVRRIGQPPAPAAEPPPTAISALTSAAPGRSVRLPGRLWSSRWLRQLLLLTVLPAILGAVLALPWISFLLRRVLLRLIAQPERAVGDSSYNSLNLALLWTGNSRLIYALAGLAALALLWRRSRAALLLIGWVAALMLMANPRTLGLPALWIISNDSVLIILFLPASLLLGAGAALLWRRLLASGLPRLPLALAGASALVLAAGIGAWQLRTIVNPSTVLASTSDLAAIRWAAENTAPDARFLVSARPWLASVDRGGDGGWWLLPLAARWTTTPPVLYTYGPTADYQQIFATTQAISKLDADSLLEFERLIQANNIDYVYTSGNEGSIPADLLARAAGLRPIFQDGTVTIYQVVAR